MFAADFVLDASVTLSWAFEDEVTPEADSVLERLRTKSAFVPPIWPFEVTNGLVVAERKGRITLNDAITFLSSLRHLPISIFLGFFEIPLEQLARVAQDTGLSAYDASYVYLAKLQHLPLATLDKSLAHAARSYGVVLLI